MSRVQVVLWVAGAIAGVLILLELSLRWLFGLGDPPLYRADPNIGYLLVPNQTVRRFGNRMEINQYSMRSPPLTQVRSPDTLRILLLGDSVANGGWWTDQPEIISERMREQMGRSLDKTAFQQVEVLNASAGSWGPRNVLAYLQRFGTFEAQVTILLINTDDLFAAPPSSAQVGSGQYPDHKPPLALAELLSRFVITESPPDAPQEADPTAANLDAVAQIRAIAQAHNSRFMLAMTPRQRELVTPREYEETARQRLSELASQWSIPYIDFLPLFRQHPHPETLYRDLIHLSPEGNAVVSQALARDLFQSAQADSPR